MYVSKGSVWKVDGIHSMSTNQCVFSLSQDPANRPNTGHSIENSHSPLPLRSCHLHQNFPNGKYFPCPFFSYDIFFTPSSLLLSILGPPSPTGWVYTVISYPAVAIHTDFFSSRLNLLSVSWRQLVFPKYQLIANLLCDIPSQMIKSLSMECLQYNDYKMLIAYISHLIPRK
jgi:hypothetical protein